ILVVFITGERVIQKQTENLALEILVNPFAQTVKHSIKKLLTSPAPVKYIIYAGHVFQSSGAWVLQDDTFAFNSFSQIFKNIDVENALKQNTSAALTIYTLAENIWETSVNRADFISSVRVHVNPTHKLDNTHGVSQFVDYVESLVKVVPITSLLRASEQFGNISFTRPTLYIFPGCQGDSALFGINGFNLLVNGGYNRRACFWDFARHLDRIDALLMTHLGTDNIFGLKTILQRKSLENVHPQIGYLYFNVLEKIGALQKEGEASVDSSKKSLLLNLAAEANKITQMAKQLGINPHPCSRNAAAANCEPINLYHKLGHGSLDMYVLNPAADSKELKEFYQLLEKESSNLGTSGAFPLQNVLSVCSLLVWKPYNLDDKIVRIFFPGNAPQHKVVEGFEKVKTFGFLKYATCTARDLTKPPAIKKPLSGPGKVSIGSKAVSMGPSSSRSETRKNLNSTKLESPSKEDKTEKSETKSLSPSKSSKSVRDENSKKNLKLDEKAKFIEKDIHLKSGEKETKAIKDVRPITVPSPVRGSGTLSKVSFPSKSVTSIKSSLPHESSPVKSATKTTKTSSAKEVAKANSASQIESDTLNVDHLDQSNLQPNAEYTDHSQKYQLESQKISETCDAVGAINTVKVIDDVSATVLTADKFRLEDLGIYEEEQDINGYEIRDKYELEDQEKPQALPEPTVMIESPSQGMEGLPDYSRTELCSQEIFESCPAEGKQTLGEEIQNNDASVVEILPSSELSCDEQQGYHYPSSVKLPSEFETPTFTNDGPDPRAANHAPVEQNIQYGINNSSNGRDMGGIQEVDEEEHDDDGSVTRENDVYKEGSADRESLRGMGICDDDEEEEVECDDEIKEDLEEEEQGSERASAERQFEDVEESTYQENQGEQDTDNSYSQRDIEDRDSIDGGTPDNEQNIDEIAVSELNGKINEVEEEIEKIAGHRFVEDTALNPFFGVEDTNMGHSVQSQDYVDESDDKSEPSFDALAHWGHPMGLPSPPLRASPNSSEKPSGAAKVDGKKRAKTAPTISKTGTRPASAAATKRMSTGSSRSSPLNAKTPILPPMTPFYVDLTYVPCHGDSLYADAEFFKRIRARYYVISALTPNPQVLDYLLEAKATWEQKELEVTIIPTYDNETLRHWMGLNAEKLQELRVDLKPAVSRCTIQLQDLETCLPAYRLEV
ncbi:unnamed protein product, partial [Candidula unifasciata]